MSRVRLAVHLPILALSVLVLMPSAVLNLRLWKWTKRATILRNSTPFPGEKPVMPPRRLSRHFRREWLGHIRSPAKYGAEQWHHIWRAIREYTPFLMLL